MFSFKFLSGKLARGCQKMYPFAHARRLTAVIGILTAGIGILASYAPMTMDMNIVCRFDSSRSCASDKSRIRKESPQSLPKFFQLVWAKPNHCNCLFLLPFFVLLHTICRQFPASRIVWLTKTNKNILRRRLVASHGFSNLINFFGKAQNKMVNQQNAGNLVNFVSEKS